ADECLESFRKLGRIWHPISEASGVVVATDEPPIVDDESFDPDFGGDPGQRKLLLRIDRELGHSKRVECDWPNHLQPRTGQLSLVSMPRARQTAEAGIAVSTGRHRQREMLPWRQLEMPVDETAPYPSARQARCPTLGGYLPRAAPRQRHAPGRTFWIDRVLNGQPWCVGVAGGSLRAADRKLPMHEVDRLELALLGPLAPQIAEPGAMGRGDAEAGRADTSQPQYSSARVRQLHPALDYVCFGRNPVVKARPKSRY